ncbi:hypothetical protein LCGC14_0580940 [marine sediment metagenome]|uniref:PDZ domain-containing protein n=1 Tax=marine sediment metagenome TaxID=412755 RepID=A0A0F9RLD3_9ZZZZ|nr:hypothetical protein [Phycisphaerae bacterium]HDZ44492.1 hypothetical protein [Phycisphaerae bacterium]
MPKRNIIWILAIIAAAVVVIWTTQHRSMPTPPAAAPVELRTVYHVRQLIKDRYAGDIDDRAVQQGAVRGMIESLDAASSYVSPDRMVGFRDHMRGLIRGFGLKLEHVDDGILVVAPLFGSPAHYAGILPGDRIVAVDGQPTAEMSFDSVYAKLNDPTRQSAELSVVRAYRPLKPIRLQRREFPIETVTGLSRDADDQWIYLIDEGSGIAYVRISEFVSETAQELQQAFRRLPETRAVVLDLRDNPGGLLPAAVAVTDLLLSEGPVVTVFSPNEGPKAYLARREGTTYPTMPVVVLINGQTASAAEIVAGALAANGRAVLIGELTLGKTSIQSMYPLPDGMGQVNITTARYVVGAVDPTEPPPGDAVGGAPGVQPHVVVPVAPELHRRLSRLRFVSALGPRILAAHLNGAAVSAPGAAPEPDLAEQISMDPQLSRAVRLLAEPGAVERILRQAAADSDPAVRGDE